MKHEDKKINRFYKIYYYLDNHNYSNTHIFIKTFQSKQSENIYKRTKSIQQILFGFILPVIQPVNQPDVESKRYWP